MKVKRLLSSIIALAMLLCSVGVPAFAAEATAVTTEAELTAAIASGGDITLGADITVNALLTVEYGVTVTLDLNGHALTQNGQYVYEDPDSGEPYDRYYNAINNYGTLTIKGTGTINGRVYNGVYTDESGIDYPASLTVDGGTIKDDPYGKCPIYNDGTAVINGGSIEAVGESSVEAIYNWGDITVNGGSVNGYIALTNDGTATVNGGTIAGTSRCFGNYGTLNLNDGNFSGDLENYGTVTVAEGKTFNFSRIWGTVPDGVTYGSIALTGTITEGVYDKVSYCSATFPAGSTAVVTLIDATLNSSKIYAGTFTGTISSITSTTLYGGTYSAQIKEFVEANKPAALLDGYAFVENTDGTYKVENVGTATFTVQSADTTGGYLSVGGIYSSGSFMDGTASSNKTLNKTNITKGTAVQFYATAVANANYTFAGWYTNAKGTGAPVYTEAQLGSSSNYISYTVNEDTTLYAVFKTNEEYQAAIDGVNAWLGDYENTTSYTVSSIEEMYQFAYAVSILGNTFAGKTVTLTASLDYTGSTVFMPVGTETYKFAGTFDGGNNTISNLTYSANNMVGIFGYSTGTIKNLKVDKCTLTSGGDIGGIAAWAEGTIQDCSVTNSKISGGNRYVGGVVGHTYGMTMTNVTSQYNTIEGNFKIGGVIGYADGLNATNVTASDNIFTSGLGSVGALAGHINAGATTLTNTNVSDAALPLVGTNYSGNGSITLNGADTKVTATCIVPDNSNSSKSVTIEEGTYTVQSIISGDTDYTTNVTITGGTFSNGVDGTSLDIEAYIADGTKTTLVDATTGNVKVVTITEAEGAASIVRSGSTLYFETLRAAVNASNNETVTLLKSVTEDITVPAGVTVTIDLNGNKLTNASGHTITNNGTLTITDTAAGGTVDNVTHAKAAILNNNGAECTILGGSFTRSLEAGTSNGNGGNSYYTVENFGTMTIGSENGDNNSISITNTGVYSSMIHNGWYTSADAEGKTAVMTIYGGTFTGGINTIKNDENGNLTINGGTFTNSAQYAVMNWNNAAITGGTFTSTANAALYNNGDSATSVGSLTVTGGTFTSSASADIVSGTKAESTAVSGGSFSQLVPDAYCAEGFVPVTELVDGMYTVKEDEVASIVRDGQTIIYKTLQEAITAAQAGETVTLLKDATISSAVTINKSITLDLNGHTVINDVQGGRPFVLTAPVTFTIEGIAEGSGMKTSAAADGATYGYIDVQATAAGSTITLNGGNYTGNTDNGAFIKLRVDDTVGPQETDAKTTVNLNNVTGTTNRCFLNTDTLMYADLNVTGGTYVSTDEVTDSNSSYDAFCVDSYCGSINFKDVSVTTNGGTCIEVCGGAARFENCTFDVTKTSNPAFVASAIGVSWEAVVDVVSGTYTSAGTGAYIFSSGGTLNVQGGTVSGEQNAVQADVGSYNNAATVNITGGEINGNIYANAVTGTTAPATVNISDGTVKGTLKTNGNENSVIAVSGGSFDAVVPAEFCAEGYVPVTVADATTGLYTVEVAPVASVTSADGTTVTNYYTLQEAITAAQAGETVTLLRDVALDHNYCDLTSTNMVPLMTITTDITLDLAGYKISWDLSDMADDYNCYFLFFSIDGANVTIKDSSTAGTGMIDAEAKYSNSFGIDIVNGGSLTIEGGTFTGATSAVQVTSGSLSITGGTFDQAATIKSAAPNLAKFVVNAIDAAYKAGTAEIAISGGTFCYDYSNYPEGAGSSYFADGYAPEEVVIDGVTYYTTVVAPVASVTSADGATVTNYYTLAEAIEKAVAGETVTLLRSGTFAELFGEGYSANNRYSITTAGITIDLNGCEISEIPNYALQIENSDITLKNGILKAELNSAKVSGYSSYALVTGKGTGIIFDGLTVTGGISVANSTTIFRNMIVHGADYYAVCVQVGGTAIIESGTYDSMCGNVLWIEGSGTKPNDAYPSVSEYGVSAMSITGGTFTVSEGKALANTDENDQAPVISGGLFNVQVPAEYCAEGYVPVTEADASGMYTVAVDTSVASVTSTDGTVTKYDTLAEAVAAALENGGEVKLLTNFTGGGIKVPSGSNLTVDFGGFTYTVTDPTVGSTGTETNGFQLLRDSNITFKNGTIKADANATSLKIMIQNYSNLTLENITIDGSANSNVQYVVSNNYGNTVMKGDTNITAPEGAVAFDVFYWPNGGYDSVSVTLDETMTGTITGKIEYGDDKTTSAAAVAEGAKLVIKSGTVNGEFAPYGLAAADPGIEISGGSFSSIVEEAYCAEGFVPVTTQDENGMYTVKAAPVASVTSADGMTVTMYDTIQEAIANAKDGETVTLLQNVTGVTATITICTNITLDLAGHTLEGSVNKTDLVKCDSGTTVTITDTGETKGKISNASATNYVYGVHSYGSALTIDGAVIEAVATGDYTAYAVCVESASDTALGSVNVKNSTIYANGVKATRGIYAKGYKYTSIITVTDSTINTTGGYYWACAVDLGYTGSGTITNTVINVNIENGTDQTTMRAISRYKSNENDFTMSGCTVTMTAQDANTKAYPINNQNTSIPLSITDGTYVVNNATPALENVSVSGGLFSFKLLDEYCAEGYVPVAKADANGMYTVTADPVAKVTNAEGATLGWYTSLTDAVAEAAAGETVTLLKDLGTLKTLTISTAITLDLNQHKIETTTAYNYIAGMIKVSADGVTIKNGTLSNNKSNSQVIIRMNNDNLTLDNVTINLTGQTSSTNASVINGSSKNVTINNSNITTNVKGGLTNANATVTGGSITLTNANAVISSGTYTDTVINVPDGSIKGGTFKKADGTANMLDEVKIAAGYMQNSTTGAVVVATYTAEITKADGTKTQYVTLQEALSAVQDGETVTLLDNIVLTEGVTLAVALNTTKAITLNLAGFTISGTDDMADMALLNVGAVNSGPPSLTIIADEGGTITSDTAYAVHVYGAGASVTIKSGTYKGNTHSVYVEQGTANIEGGAFSVTSADAKSLLNCLDTNYKNSTANIVVTGGTFTAFDPANNEAEGTGTNFVADGYESVYDEANNTYTVQLKADYVTVTINGEVTAVKLGEAFTKAAVEGVVAYFEYNNTDGTIKTVYPTSTGADYGTLAIASVTEDITLEPQTLGEALVDGAQVRIGQGVDANNKIAPSIGAGDTADTASSGLRFIAVIDSGLAGNRESIAQIGNGNEYTVELGIEITAEGGGSVKIKAEKFQDGETASVFSAALVNLAESNYNRVFTAKPYVTLKVVNDNTEYTYYGSEVSRSIYEIAAGILVDGTVEGNNKVAVTINETVKTVLNAYVNQVGIRLELTNGATNPIDVRSSGKNGAYVGGKVGGPQIFFEVQSAKNSDGTYTVTITPKENAEIFGYWKDYIRLNNQSLSKYITNADSALGADGVLTLTIDPTNGSSSSAAAE